MKIDKEPIYKGTVGSKELSTWNCFSPRTGSLLSPRNVRFTLCFEFKLPIAKYFSSLKDKIFK